MPSSVVIPIILCNIRANYVQQADRAHVLHVVLTSYSNVFCLSPL